MLNDSTKWTRAIWDRHGGFFFWISHVRRLSCKPAYRLPLTSYHLPATSYHLPFATLHQPRRGRARARVRGRGHILSLCHFALDDTFFNLRAQ